VAENEKRIVIRLDPKKWEKYDDKRHSERVSFQQLGERLLASWFSIEGGGKVEGISSGLTKDSKGDPDDVVILPNRAQPIPEEFQPWVSYLLHILTENNAFAAPSIKKNLEAFVRLTDLDGGSHGPPPGEPEDYPWGGRPPGHILQEASELRADAARIIEEHHGKRPRRRKNA